MTKSQNGKCLEAGKRPNPLWDKTVPNRGAPNDLEYGRGVTGKGKCLETGKRPNPLLDKTVPDRGALNDFLDV